MKKILYLCAFAMLLLSSNLYAQDTEYKTIFNTKETSLSGWGALDIKVGQVLYDEISIYMGGKGGVLINKIFTIGFAGYGLVPSHRLESISELRDDYTDVFLGYGGLYLEYIIKPMNPVHLNVNCLVGGGGVGYIGHSNMRTENALVIEPGINVGLNLTENFRIDVGGSYRYVSRLDIIQTDDVRGFSANIAFKFGRFN